MFWETLPGLIASWAAAIAGIGFIWSKVWKAWKFSRRLTTAAMRLIEIANEDEWPNGSKTLPQSITEIYKRQSKTHELLEAYIVSHRLDHDLT